MKTLPVEARQELEASYTYDPINGRRHAPPIWLLSRLIHDLFCKNTQICRAEDASHHQSNDRRRQFTRRRAGYWCRTLRRDDL